MMHFRNYREGLDVFKALSSETRVRALEILIEHGPMRMSAIAEMLGITGGALTTHMKMLVGAGLVLVETTGAKHGLQKICQARDVTITVDSPYRSQKG